MIKVITYGTYDLLHHGHVRLLERAKALGDYLIVGVTADGFDRDRGKINIQQSLMERIEAVKATGIADEVIVEEYEGQKIDDIRKYGIDIFTVGSDWVDHFDYLKEYCQVIYLPRTEGISSSELRTQTRRIKMGLVGDTHVVEKFMKECAFVNGVEVVGVCSNEDAILNDPLFSELEIKTREYNTLIDRVDAVYLVSHPKRHYEQIKHALLHNKHVICESPITMSLEKCEELFCLAKKQQCILMEAIKTAYSTAYTRLLVMLKSGKIGRIVSVDTTCTSLSEYRANDVAYLSKAWNSICAWGPTALLPVFQLLGTEYKQKRIVSAFADENKTFDLFTKIEFEYESAVASVKVGKGVKSEGEMVISGTKGYIYVPAPWWKTDYFEVRYEDPRDTKKIFYPLEGEGIRYGIVAFLKAIKNGSSDYNIPMKVTKEICKVIEDFDNKKDVNVLSF